MPSNKLMFLAGLGASATAAVAGPASTLGGTSEPAPFQTTNPFQPSNADTNLFRKCTYDIFQSLDDPEYIKKEISGEEDPSKFQLPTWDTSKDQNNFKGCLKLDLKHHKDSNKGNLVATIEMAVSKGENGIIVLNSISNQGESGYGFYYRAFFLYKLGGKWGIKGGVQWSDPLFPGSSKPDKVKLTLPQDENIEEVFWKNRICPDSSDCETKLNAINNPDNKNIVYEWKKETETTGKNIFQDLKIEALSPSTGSPKSDFWNGEETPLSDNSTVVTQPDAIYVGGDWKKPKGQLLEGKKDKLVEWFNKFKDDKGKWEKKTGSS